MPDPSLVGTWALVATEWRRADGRHANPFGPNAVGMLTYDAAGNMSAQIMRATRPAVPEGQATGIETALASVFAGYIAYFGTYVVDRGAVVHTVIGSTFPAWVSASVTRRFTLEDDRLTLNDSVTASDGTAVEASTVWQRIS